MSPNSVCLFLFWFQPKSLIMWKQKSSLNEAKLRSNTAKKMSNFKTTLVRPRSLPRKWFFIFFQAIWFIFNVSVVLRLLLLLVVMLLYLRKPKLNEFFTQLNLFLNRSGRNHGEIVNFKKVPKNFICKI